MSSINFGIPNDLNIGGNLYIQGVLVNPNGGGGGGPSSGIPTLNGLSGALTLAGRGIVAVTTLGTNQILISGDQSISGALTQSGVQALDYSAGMGGIISGNLTATGVQLGTKIDFLSGFTTGVSGALQSLIAGGGTQVKITGSSTLSTADFTGLGGTLVFWSGSKVFISGAGSAGVGGASSGIPTLNGLSGALNIVGTGNTISVYTGAGVINIAVTGIANLPSIISLSGNMTSTGVQALAYAAGIGTIISGNLTQTGVQALNYANGIGTIISGNLTSTGVQLGAKIDSLSGFTTTMSGALNALIAGGGTQVRISGSSTLSIADFTGIGGTIVLYSGGKVFISGGAGGGGSFTAATTGDVNSGISNTLGVTPLSLAGLGTSITVLRRDGTSTHYTPAQNTNGARGSGLVSVVSNSVSGDTVILSAQSFDLGFTGIQLPAYVNLRGAGQYATTILSQVSNGFRGMACVAPGTGSELSDFSLYANATGTNGGFDFLTYQAPIGFDYFGGNSVPSYFTIRRVFVSGDSDSFFVKGNTGSACSAKIYDSVFRSNFDSSQIECLTGANSQFDFYNCDFIAIGPSISFNPAGVATAFAVRNGGTSHLSNTQIRVYGGRWFTSGGTTSNFGLDARETSGPGFNVELHDVSILTTGGNAQDINLTDFVQVDAYACKINENKLTISDTGSSAIRIHGDLGLFVLTGTVPTSTSGQFNARLIAVSGVLQAQIGGGGGGASSGIPTLNGLSGALTLVGTGGLTVSTVGTNKILISGDQSISGYVNNISGIITSSITPIAKGGTSSTTAVAARAALNVGETALTWASTIATDCSLGNVFKIQLTGNATLGAPSNLQAGATYMWKIQQDLSGKRTLAYNSVFKFSSGLAPTLTTGVSGIDIISSLSDGTNVFSSFMPDFR